jgi:hypothetical protein
MRRISSPARPVLIVKGPFVLAAIGLVIVFLVLIIRAYFTSKPAIVGTADLMLQELDRGTLEYRISELGMTRLLTPFLEQHPRGNALRLAFLKTCAMLFAVVFFSELYLNSYSTLIVKARGGTRCGRGRENRRAFHRALRA